MYCGHCGAPRTGGDATCQFCGIVHQQQVHAEGKAGAPPGVLEALRAGNKIDAIRLYREAKKTGLKESKEAVDELEKKLVR